MPKENTSLRGIAERKLAVRTWTRIALASTHQGRVQDGGVQHLRGRPHGSAHRRNAAAPLASLSHPLRRAEVAQLGHQLMASNTSVKQHICTFDVAVKNALTVQIFQCMCDVERSVFDVELSVAGSIAKTLTYLARFPDP
eukprot:CAMPEP_0114294020 /NCGR_PEP_ID=MMETSP0059-20121206/9900_1 /TAXON_ID=36894 /ORGANISM="Pyramimonas parkeae, Strain CCMP726" /LENGTH=139 /DNA_ID=CAMNT_0001415763 /DNA_START=709 /DNA_END=1128 /DNA_ORIENTATION=-